MNVVITKYSPLTSRVMETKILGYYKIFPYLKNVFFLMFCIMPMRLQFNPFYPPPFWNTIRCELFYDKQFQKVLIEQEAK